MEYSDYIEENYECPVCGGYTDNKDHPCSSACFEADMM